MSRKQRLELTWIGKEARPRVEPRLLLPDESKSYCRRTSPTDILDNALIFGDNLLALKALELNFASKIKCVYIDPPFNTQQAFEHYDDGVEHSIWLSLLRDRAELIRSLLSDDGSLWLHLDDSEIHRARCVLDEVFGAANFIATVIWEKSDSPRMDAEFFSSRHDYILVFAKDKMQCRLNRVPEEALPAHYDKVDEAGRPYYLKPLRAMGGQGDSRAARPNLFFAMIAPDGAEVFPKRQDGSDGAWRWSREKTELESNRIEWAKGRGGWTPYFRIYGTEDNSRPPETIWTHQEVGSNRTSKAEAKTFVEATSAFSTPKPERLLHRVLLIATNPGDIVLDSFAGSGTTGAVAHKMRRRWIMVEQGPHADTHIIPRLRKVIDGADQGGATGATGWRGGGGYTYLYLAPSLIERDVWGNEVISTKYNAAMLAEAMCRHMGFDYAPDPDHFWMHGRSTERDFIYVTTAALTHEQLRKISDLVGPERTLLVCCRAFQKEHVARLENLTVRKIPQAVLAKCEWGKDDYSMGLVEGAPPLEDQPDAEPTPSNRWNAETPKTRKRKKPKTTGLNTPLLFDDGGKG